jgi:hypothetical protein
MALLEGRTVSVDAAAGGVSASISDDTYEFGAALGGKFIGFSVTNTKSIGTANDLMATINASPALRAVMEHPWDGQL